MTSSILLYQRYKVKGKGFATFRVTSEEAIELNLEVDGGSSNIHGIRRRTSPAMIREWLLREYRY